MQNTPIQAGRNVDSESDGALFDSQEQFQKELTTLCHGDFYVIGRLWIQALRSVLVGASLSLFPTVKAAKAPETPQRPPKMKYKDLPIYESPHYEYKDYIEDQKKCPNADEKLLQAYLLPKVSNYRKSWVDSITEFNKDARELRDDACKGICKQREEFIRYMRHPDNYTKRQGVVVTGAAVGYYYSSGSSSLIKKLFFTTLGALATGALCFPEATDEVFRNVSFRVGKVAVCLVNCVCGRSFVLRDKLPCKDEMPNPPPDRPAAEKNKCDNKPKK